MPRTSKTPQDATVPGVDITFSAPDPLGDVVDVGRGLVLIVRNASAGTITVTLQTPGDVEGLAIAENAFTCQAGDISMFKMDASTYGRAVGVADEGRAYVDYSAVASVTSALIRTI